MPSWLSFDSSTRTFFGIPLENDVGTLHISVNIYLDEDEWVTSQEIFSIEVLPVPLPPSSSLQVASKYNIADIEDFRTEGSWTTFCSQGFSLYPLQCSVGSSTVTANIYISSDIASLNPVKRIKVFLSVSQLLAVCPLQLTLYTESDDSIGFIIAEDGEMTSSTRLSLLIHCDGSNIYPAIIQDTVQSLGAILNTFVLNDTIKVQAWSITSSTNNAVVPRRVRRFAPELNIQTSSSDEFMTESIPLLTSSIVPFPSRVKSVPYLLVTSEVITSDDELSSLSLTASSAPESFLTISVTMPEVTSSSAISPSFISSNTDILLPSSIEFSSLPVTQSVFTSAIGSISSSVRQSTEVFTSSVGISTSDMFTETLSISLFETPSLSAIEPFPMSSSEPFPMSSSERFPMSSSEPFPMSSSEPIPTSSSELMLPSPSSPQQSITASFISSSELILSTDIATSSSDFFLAPSFTDIAMSTFVFASPTPSLLEPSSIDIESTSTGIFVSTHAVTSSSEFLFESSFMETLQPFTSSEELFSSTSKSSEMIFETPYISIIEPFSTSELFESPTSDFLQPFTSSEILFESPSLSILLPSSSSSSADDLHAPEVRVSFPLSSSVKPSSIDIVSSSVELSSSDDIFLESPTPSISSTDKITSSFEFLFASSSFQLFSSSDDIIVSSSELLFQTPTPSFDELFATSISSSDKLPISSSSDKLLISSTSEMLFLSPTPSFIESLTTSVFISSSDEFLSSSSDELFTFSSTELVTLAISSSITPSQTSTQFSTTSILEEPFPSISELFSSSDEILFSSSTELFPFSSPTKLLTTSEVQFESPSLSEFIAETSTIEFSLLTSFVSKILTSSSELFLPSSIFIETSSFSLSESPTPAASLFLSESVFEETSVYESSFPASTIFSSSQILLSSEDPPLPTSTEELLTSSSDMLTFSRSMMPSSSDEETLPSVSLESSLGLSLEFSFSSSVVPSSYSKSLAFSPSPTSSFETMYPTLTSFAPSPSPTNTAPMLLNPIGGLLVQEGTIFSYTLPDDMFYDIEDGYNLTLSLHNKRNWIGLNNQDSIIGLPLSTEITNHYLTKYEVELRAYDHDGEFASEVISISVSPRHIFLHENYIQVSIDENFTLFDANITAKVDLVTKLVRPDPNGIYIYSLSPGSVVITYTNISIRNDDCTEFNKFTDNIYSNRSYTNSFQALIDPYIPIQFLKVFGPCNKTEQGTIETIQPTIGVVQDTVSERLIFLAVVVSVVSLACLLLIACVIAFITYRWKRQERRYILEGEHKILLNRKPVVFLDESESLTRSRKPTIFTTRSDGYRSLIHTEPHELNDAFTPIPEQDETVSLTDEALECPFVEIIEPSQHHAPPTYRLPPQID